MRYLLDTTFLIDLLRDQAAARARWERLFEDGDAVFVNEVVVCEAATGAHDGTWHDLVAIMQPIEFIQPGPESALEAGRWRAEARRAGRTLSLPDALIAAAAHAVEATILTRNVRDFSLTPVPVEAY